ncbi:MAG: hypothetical protein OXI24_20270 [Candidatus Poribacteria bacterium]|nr:hypothetical protein [Candidatus Poribacteria bacterium]
MDAGIGTSQLAPSRREGEDIVAEVVTQYAGREIGRERQSLKGALLREALASLILSGSLFSGVGENLKRAIDAWLRCCYHAGIIGRCNLTSADRYGRDVLSRL